MEGRPLVSTFQGRSLSTSTFCDFLQMIGGVVQSYVLAGLYACRQCLKLLNTSSLPRCKPLLKGALLASLSALSCSLTPASPGQGVLKGGCGTLTHVSLPLAFPFYILCVQSSFPPPPNPLHPKKEEEEEEKHIGATKMQLNDPIACLQLHASLLHWLAAHWVIHCISYNQHILQGPSKSQLTASFDSAAMLPFLK